MRVDAASVPALPRLLKISQAAVYLGISPSKLITLPIPRRMAGKNRLYDRLDLDEWADNLPYEQNNGTNTCDEVFG